MRRPLQYVSEDELLNAVAHIISQPHEFTPDELAELSDINAELAHRHTTSQFDA